MDGSNNHSDSVFIETPFDSLIVELWQSALRNPDYKTLTPLGLFVFNQLKLLRVVYLSYSSVSLRDGRLHPQSMNQSVAISEMLQSSDYGLKVMMNYRLFIDSLNQLGRCLSRKYKINVNIPSYWEIYFFRNKISEHWDDYILMKPGGSALRGKDKFPIPILPGKRCLIKEALPLKKTLENEFSKCGVCLDDIDDRWYSDYSQEIYSKLKEIDLELKSETRSKSKKNVQKYIPDSLISLLFQFEFPLPHAITELIWVIIVNDPGF